MPACAQTQELRVEVKEKQVVSLLVRDTLSHSPAVILLCAEPRVLLKMYIVYVNTAGCVRSKIYVNCLYLG